MTTPETTQLVVVDSNKKERVPSFLSDGSSDDTPEGVPFSTSEEQKNNGKKVSSKIKKNVDLAKITQLVDNDSQLKIKNNPSEKTFSEYFNPSTYFYHLEEAKIKDTPPETKSTKNKVKKNQFGNVEDVDGFVIETLPVGLKGENIQVVVGVQDPEPKKGDYGLKTVLSLQSMCIEDVAIKNGYKILTQEMVNKIKKKDVDFGLELQNILDKTENKEDAISMSGDEENDEGDDSAGSE